MNIGVEKFLRVIFEELENGFIEIRVIQEKKGGDVVERTWNDSPAELVADLPRLLQAAERENAAIFFGVLPRRERGKGMAVDVLPGRLVWADLDIKSYAGGEAEMRARLADFPIPPTLVVFSGHGRHAYWLLKEAADPETLSAFSKAFGRALGGDHTFDAARLLRLPETYNRKDPSNPILVTIELFEPANVYDASEIIDAIEMVESTAFTPPPSEPGASESKNHGTGLSERVSHLLSSNRKLRDYFFGTGKPVKRSDGLDNDCSSSGYDYSLALGLAREGVLDEVEVAQAVAARPDGEARAKGRAYILRTVRAVLDLLRRQESGDVEPPKLSFEVEEVFVFPSTPASYALVIDGRRLVVRSAVLRSVNKFQLAFLDTFHRLPAMPKAEQWPQVVNAWLSSAKRIEQPPEATDEIARAEEIQRIVEELPICDDSSDLDRGKAMVLEGQKVFKTATITRALADASMPTPQNVVCLHLRGLGFTYSSLAIAGKKTRVWGCPWNAS